MSVIEDDRDTGDLFVPAIPLRLARLRRWMRTHLVLPAILYFALMVSIWYVATHSGAWVSAGSVNDIRESEAEAVALSYDGGRLAVLDRDGSVSFWDTRSGNSLWTVQEDPSGTPRSIQESVSAYVLGITQEPLHVLVENKDTGERRVHLFPEKTQHLWRRSSIVFSPDGKLLAVGRPDGAVVIRDARSGSAISQVAGHPWTLSDVRFSPDGSTLATTSFDREAALWDVRTAELRKRIGDFEGPVFCACFSPDGRTLVTGGHDGTLRFISTSDGSTLRSIDAHDGPVFTLAFSHDGTLVASAADDEGPKALQIRSAESLELLGSTGPRTLPVFMSFARDDRTLLVVHAFWDRRATVFSHKLPCLSRSSLACGFGRVSTVSGNGQVSASLGTTGFTSVCRLRRPERWWGIFWLPSLWVAVCVAGAFAAALVRDVRHVRRLKRGHEEDQTPAPDGGASA